MSITYVTMEMACTEMNLLLLLIMIDHAFRISVVIGFYIYFTDINTHF